MEPFSATGTPRSQNLSSCFHTRPATPNRVETVTPVTSWIPLVVAVPVSTTVARPRVTAHGRVEHGGVGPLEHRRRGDRRRQLGDREVHGGRRVGRVVVGQLGRHASGHLMTGGVQHDDRPSDRVPAERGRQMQHDRGGARCPHRCSPSPSAATTPPPRRSSLRSATTRGRSAGHAGGVPDSGSGDTVTVAAYCNDTSFSITHGDAIVSPIASANVTTSPTAATTADDLSDERDRLRPPFDSPSSRR